jgi:16S rRNA (guanine527-N7)-methyltransferase
MHADFIDTTLLTSGAEQYGVTLSPIQLNLFVRYAEILADWNERINLTSTAVSEYVPRHFIDSLSLLAVLPGVGDISILDVGSGAGFPGIPLAIACPHFKITLLESLQKRVFFLEEVVAKLDLQNVQVVRGRAEDMAKDNRYARAFPVVTARAVAKLKSLLPWLSPFMASSGRIVCMKAKDLEAEIKEAQDVCKKLGLELTEQKIVQPLGCEVERTLLLFQKRK